jgi:hypothetical protein
VEEVIFDLELQVEQKALYPKTHEIDKNDNFTQ